MLRLFKKVVRITWYLTKVALICIGAFVVLSLLFVKLTQSPTDTISKSEDTEKVTVKDRVVNYIKNPRNPFYKGSVGSFFVNWDAVKNTLGGWTDTISVRLGLKVPESKESRYCGSFLFAVRFAHTNSETI